MVRWLEQQGRGAAQVNYKLRDWLFARQRYWGEPFPIVFPEGSEVCQDRPSQRSCHLIHRLISLGLPPVWPGLQEPQAISEDDLPLTLPETDNFKPSGSPESPLANISDWVEFTDSATGEAQPCASQSPGVCGQP